MKRIFLHGLGQGPGSWDEVLAALGEAGVCPDLSALLSAGEATYPGLYRGLCAALEGEDSPLSLCGLSLGAVLALQYALDHPERVDSLTLIAPQYQMPKGLLTLQNLAFRLMPASAFGEMGLGKKDILTLTSSMMELNFTDRLGELSCPALVLCGERDKANRKAAKALVALNPMAQFQLVSGAGHELNRDRPEALAALLKEFWKNCSDEKGGLPT